MLKQGHLRRTVAALLAVAGAMLMYFATQAWAGVALLILGVALEVIGIALRRKA